MNEAFGNHKFLMNKPTGLENLFPNFPKHMFATEEEK
jgi:hypothetical protein